MARRKKGVAKLFKTKRAAVKGGHTARKVVRYKRTGLKKSARKKR